jgi:homogentisate phytyltransferase/homogentisate geranylgeranyltransferase
MKDVPDVAGDKLASIRTFSVRIGQTTIFQMMKRLLASLFFIFGAGFMNAALTTNDLSLTLSRVAVGISALLACFSVNKEAAGLDPENSEDVYGYYMHLWKLFYLSYLVLPFAR